MKNIKQQFIDFREHTPKHIQWLLLIAAFIVVIILLTLLLGKTFTGKKTKTQLTPEQPVNWSFNPTELEFTDVNIGDSKSQQIDLTVSDVVFVEGIKIDADNEDDWNTDGNSCMGKLEKNCSINVVYTPHVAQSETETVLVVTYHLPNDEDVAKQEIPVTFSAKENIIEKPVEPIAETVTATAIVEEEPDHSESDVIDTSDENNEPVSEQNVEPESDLTDFQETVAEEISAIAPQNSFEDLAEQRITDIVLPSTDCSEFAIPGYNQSGVQIGWIKPERGANYFHPFSDKDCSRPTGKYDWATGIITSLKDGSRIGTDADHIGYRNIKNRGLTLPALSAPTKASNGEFDENAIWATGGGIHKLSELNNWTPDLEKYKGSAFETESVVNSQPYDRTFILRQFKPIPATIVSEVRADPSVYGCSGISGSEKCTKDKNHSIPVRATVDRNVFSDDGRTIIIPTGTLLMGYLEGDLPGPYQSFGRMNIKWYQFIRPDGVEFNFPTYDQDPYSGDAQGRVGVPGRGSTDYVEQMVIPILTAMVPAAVNMIAPIADTFVNQINLDDNTVVQTGTMRSSEMAKQEIINSWNKITNKLVVDAISNTVPPFSIPAGTRINVYSPVDLILTCGNGADAKGKNCAFTSYDKEHKRRKWSDLKDRVSINTADSSWIGQVRAWNLDPTYCKTENGKKTIGDNWAQNPYGYDYRTVLIYCESLNYQAKNMAKNEVYTQQQQQQFTNTYGTQEQRKENPQSDQAKAYNQDILGLQYAEDGTTVLNPFAKPASAAATPAEEVLTCEDGSMPDINGCCAGETYTDMGEQGFNCCPNSGGDCFPPITMN